MLFLIVCVIPHVVAEVQKRTQREINCLCQKLAIRGDCAMSKKFRLRKWLV